METATKRRAYSDGRPPIGPKMPLRLPREWSDALDALARERKTSRSALIRQAVAQAYPETVPASVDPHAPRYAPRVAYPE